MRQPSPEPSSEAGFTSPGAWPLASMSQTSLRKPRQSFDFELSCCKLANRQEQQQNTSKPCLLGSRDYWVEWGVECLSRSVKKKSISFASFYHLSFLFSPSYCFTLNDQQNVTITMKPLFSSLEKTLIFLSVHSKNICFSIPSLKATTFLLSPLSWVWSCLFLRDGCSTKTQVSHLHMESGTEEILRKGPWLKLT